MARRKQQIYQYSSMQDLSPPPICLLQYIQFVVCSR